jgi:hypothetical protein
MTEWPPSSKPFLTSPPDGAVGIALPIRDDLRFFKLCFHSVMSFADHRFMLTVVDNMSGIKTVQYLESLRRNHPINVLRYQSEHNLAAEWNLALRYMFAHTTVKYGVALTPTIIVEPFWLSSLVKAINAHNKPVMFRSNAGSAHAIGFKREHYEQINGFDEAYDPIMDMTERIGTVVVPDLYAHKFTVNGFDPRSVERDLMETREAQRVTT